MNRLTRVRAAILIMLAISIIANQLFLGAGFIFVDKPMLLVVGKWLLILTAILALAYTTLIIVEAILWGMGSRDSYRP